VELVLQHRAEIGEKIGAMERATDDLAGLTATLDPLTRQLEKLGGELTAKRKAAAARLSPLIERPLAELGMEKAKFTIAVNPAPVAADGTSATPSGFDAIEFIAQTNPGLPAQPLRKIASGGELSRIMLALKGVLAQ